MTNIKIISPTLDDVSRLQEFYACAYRPDHVLMNKKFLQWWLYDNPYYEGSGLSCDIAVDGEKIIGHFAHVPVDIWAESKLYNGAWTGNFFVDESYRGQGIGSMLIKSVMSKYQTTMDVGANELAEKVLQKNGWVHFGNLRRLVGIFDLPSAQPLAIDKSVLEHCVIDNSGNNNGDANISEVVEFSDDYDRFWHGYRDKIIASTNRTAKFLNWRYAKHPLFKYRLVEAKIDEKIKGIAVFRVDPIKDIERPAIRIVEFIAESGVEDNLLKWILKFAREENAILVDFFSTSSQLGGVFEKFGFCNLPYSNQIARLFSPVVLSAREISFNGANCRGELPEDIFQNQELWYVTSGDGDQDRPNYSA